MGWQKDEQEYLGILSDVCIDISNKFHDIYFLRKKTMTKIKVPAIMIGSITGVVSLALRFFQKMSKDGLLLLSVFSTYV